MFAEAVDEWVRRSDAELVDRLRALELERRRADAEMAMLLAISTQRGLCAVDGHHSMTAWIRANFNWSTGEAARFVQLSKAVDRVDGLGEAWMVGRFAMPQAQRMAKLSANPRVSEQLPGFAGLLLENAEQLSYKDFASAVEHFEACADEDGAHNDRDDAIANRSATVTDVAGTLHVRAFGGDPLATAEVVSIFERFEQAEFEIDCALRRELHGELADSFNLARTPAQRRHDALIKIFHAAAAHTGEVIGFDPLVNIVIDSTTWGQLLAAAGLAPTTDLSGAVIDPFTGLTPTPPLLDHLTTNPYARCETTTGQQLHPHDVLRAALAGRVRRVVIDSNSVVIDQGRTQRLYTGSARIAAKLLLKHCDHPGCELPSQWCQVDHANEWVADSGSTDQSNANVRCGSHNREKHRKRWRSRRATNGRTFTIRPDGTIMLPVGIRPPTFDDEVDQARVDNRRFDELGA